MSSETLAPPAEHRATGMALAALGPIAVGGIVAARSEAITPLLSTPAIFFGVIAATAPALYIALAATGDAPPISKVARAFGVAFAAFGVALAGLVLPAAFLAASSTSPITTYVVATAVLGIAGLLALLRLARELASPDKSLMASLVFFMWAASTAGITGRLWFDLVQELS
jgi:uncharacterized membrane protein